MKIVRRGLKVAADFYPGQGRCGPMQIRGTLAAYGVEVHIDDINTLYVSRLQSQWDVTLPWNVVALLREHDVEARLRFSPRNRIIADLRHSLEVEHLTIVLYQATRRRGGLHWGSILGITDEHFILYDSQYEKSFDAPTLPIGNALFPHDKILGNLPKLFLGQGTFWIEVLGRNK